MRLLPLLVVAALGSACAVPQAPARASIAPPGWTVVTKSETNDAVGVSKVSTGFRIAIPPKWQETQQDGSTREAGDRALASANPAYAQAVAQQQTGPSGSPPMVFSAVDPEGPVVQGIFATTIYVTGQHIDRPITADTMARSMQYYRQQTLGATLWSSAHAVIDGRDGMRLQMKYELRGATGERTVISTLQYIVVQDRDIFIIEFSGVWDEMDVLTPVFESIAETFKIL